MKKYRIFSFRVCILFVISLSSSLVGCSGGQSQTDPSRVSIVIPTSTIVSQTLEENGVSSSETNVIAPQPITVGTPIPSTEDTVGAVLVVKTVIPIPTTTATPTPSPTATLTATESNVYCENTERLPEISFPEEVDIRSGDVVLSRPFMYLSVANLIGVFDISTLGQPEFLGFWELSELSEISSMKVDDGMAYVASDSTLSILNVNPQCRFASIANIEMPFHIYHIEIEGDRLYVGGTAEDQEQSQVSIFSVNGDYHFEELDIVELGQEPTLWSVFEGDIYSYALKRDEMSITDVSEAETQSQIVDLPLDTSILSDSWVRIVGDTLYLLSEINGVFVINDMMNESPNVVHNSQKYILVDDFRVDDDYIFLSNNSCDGIECGSVTWILTSDTVRQLMQFGLRPHYPVYQFKQIADDLVYAFTPDSLLVIDISRINDPIIIDEISLTK